MSRNQPSTIVTTLALLAAAGWLAPSARAQGMSYMMGVDAVSPANGASDAALDGEVRAKLTKAIDPALVKAGAATMTLTRISDQEEVEGTVRYESNERTLVFRPDSPLDPGQQYSVTCGVLQLGNPDGIVMAVWSFTTVGKSATGGPKPADGGVEEEETEPEPARPPKPPEGAGESPAPKPGAGELKKGIAALEKGDLLSAAPAFETARRLDPKDPWPPFCLAEVWLRWYLTAHERNEPPEAHQYREDRHRIVTAVVEGLCNGTAPWTEEFGVAAKGHRILRLGPLVERILSEAGGQRPTPALCWRVLAESCSGPEGDAPAGIPTEDPAWLFHLAWSRYTDADRSAGASLRFARATILRFGESRAAVFEGILTHPGADEAAKGEAEYWLARASMSRSGRPDPAGSRREGGDLRNAESHFRLALKHRADFPEAMIGLAVATFRQGKYKMALAYLRKLVEKHPDATDAHLYLSILCSDPEVKDGPGAAAALERALETGKDRGATLERYSALLFGEGRDPEGVDALLRAAEASPGDAGRWLRASRCCYEQGAFEKALPPAERAVEAGNRELATWLLLAELRKRDGSMKKALAACDEALAIAPRERAVWRTIRLCGTQWGVRREAAEMVGILREKEKRHGASAASAAEMGFFLALEKSYDDAAREYVRAFGFKGEERTVLLSLREVGRVLGQRFRELQDAIQTEDPTREDVGRIWDQMVDAAWERMWRRMDRELRRSGSAMAAGVSSASMDSHEAMRDWQMQTAGSFGAVGLTFTRAE